MQWEVVIGLENHVQLTTNSKIFSGSSIKFGAEPNTQASPVDLALPGVLPVMNKRRGRARDPLRPGGRREDRAALGVRAQELLLPRPAEGLPDQPVRRPGGPGRHPDLRVREGRQAGNQDRQPDPRPPGRRRRQIAARGLPRHERHRPEPRRHAAAGNRVRAGNAQRGRSGRLRQGPARAGDVAGRLRRQHAGRLVPLRRQRLGAPGRPAGIRHPLRDQEPELLPLHGRGDPLRSAAPDRADRRRRQGGAGDPPVGPGPQGNPRRCAARKTRRTTATSPTRTCRRWPSRRTGSSASRPACRNCRPRCASASSATTACRNTTRWC